MLKLCFLITIPQEEKDTHQKIVYPILLGEMEYVNKTFLDLKAFCTLREQERNFNIEKIIEMYTRD